jgi:hypothetical protein
MSAESWTSPGSRSSAALAADIERRLVTRPRRRPRRRVKPATVIASTVMFLWLMGFGGAVVGAVMVGDGYRIDMMQTQLTGLVRQEQLLAGQVALATNPGALAQDAQRLHVPLSPVRVAPIPVPRTISRVSSLWSIADAMASLKNWVRRIQANVTRGHGSRGS